MPKDEWGVKRVCPHCGVRFYDLRTDPMTCPSCSTTFSVESLTSVKAKALRPEKVKPEAAADIDELGDIETEAPEADDELDDEILEDDDDNVDIEEIADVAAEDDDA